MNHSLKDLITRHVRSLAALSAVAFGIVACDVHGVSDPGSLASMTVTPNATLAVGATQQMTAVGMDAEGRTVSITPTWSVAAGGGTVAQTGIFTAGGVAGVFPNTVVATVGTITAHATMTIVVGPLATITVTPNPVTLAIGGTQTFTAVGKDASGNVVSITPTWGVVAGGGTIAQTGLFTAGQLTGTYLNTISARVGAIVGTATVTVTSGPLASIAVTPNPVTLINGATQQFTAVGKDAGGNTITGTTVVWSVANGGGTINATGLFTAGTLPATYSNTVTATSGSISGTATVIVTVGALATITVTPNPASLITNATQQFIAVGRDAALNIVPLTPVWTVVNGGGTIGGATGIFTAGSTQGTFTNSVMATSGAISGTATVVVTAGALATITVTPNPASLLFGSTQQFVAVGRDNNNNIVTIVPTWSVVNGGGTITTTGGLFTAGQSTGTYLNTVVATSGLITGTATVNVTQGAATSITVSPNPASVLTGATQQFSAVGRDAGNNLVAVQPTWSVINGGGTINAVTGLFTAGATVGTFSNTVLATFGTASGSATVDVTSSAVVSPLGAAAPFGVLAGTGISCAISGSIAGSSSNIGSSPTLTVTGFPPCTYTGSIPLPAVIATAKNALTIAYLTAQNQVCDVVLTGTDLGFYDGSTPAKTLVGDKTYCFSTSAALTGTLKLTGSATAKWTFQVGSTLTAAVSSQVILAGGAIADNVYWAVGTSATLNTNSTFQGNIMALTSITLTNGATLNGRALAQNGAVDMTAGAATIIKP